MKRFFFNRNQDRHHDKVGKRSTDKNNNKGAKIEAQEFAIQADPLLPKLDNAVAEEPTANPEYETLAIDSLVDRADNKMTIASIQSHPKFKQKAFNCEMNLSSSLPTAKSVLNTDIDNYVVYGLCGNSSEGSEPMSLVKIPHSNALPAAKILIDKPKSISEQVITAESNEAQSSSAVSVPVPIPRNARISLQGPSPSNIVSFLTACCIPTTLSSVAQVHNDTPLSENRIVYTTIAFEPTSSRSLLPSNLTDDVKSASVCPESNNNYVLPLSVLTMNNVCTPDAKATNHCSAIVSVHEVFCNCQPSCCCHCQCASVANLSECLACFHTVCGQLSDAHYCKLGSYEHVYPPPIEPQNAAVVTLPCAIATTATGDASSATAKVDSTATPQNRLTPQNSSVYSKDMVSKM